MNKILLSAFALLISFSSCDAQVFKKLGKSAANAASDAVKGTTGSTGSTGTTKSLSNEDVISGLREALTVGTNNSTAFASKLDGFYKNPALFIPFPPEAQKVKDYANKVGMSAQVDKFEMTLNRAAEEATKDAAGVFVNAIKGMSVSDGFAILKGNDDAATQYLKDKTNAELTAKFSPIVKKAIDKVQLTKYWSPIITAYNKVPLVQKQNPDLNAYVTERAIQGLFKLIAEEEKKIRKDPVSQVTELLQNVFGSLTN